MSLNESKRNVKPILKNMPQPMDVILGRGKTYRKNPGNKAFQDLIQSYGQLYYKSSNITKREITMDIIRAIQNTGRFIVWKGDKWVQVGDDTARQKTAHAFQYHIRNLLSKSTESSHSILTSQDLGAIVDDPHRTLRQDAMVDTLTQEARKRYYDHDHKNESTETVMDRTMDPLPYQYFDMSASALDSDRSDERKNVLPYANSLDASNCCAFDDPDLFLLDSNNNGNNNDRTYPFIKLPHDHSFKLHNVSINEVVACNNGCDIPDARSILASDNTKQPSKNLKAPPIAPNVTFHDRIEISMLESIVDDETKLHESASSVDNYKAPSLSLQCKSTKHDDGTTLTGVVVNSDSTMPCPLDSLVRAASDFSRDDL